MMKKKYYKFELNMTTLNIGSILLLVLMFLITMGLYRLIGKEFIISNKDFLICMGLLIPYFMLHEVLHSIGYVVNGAKFNKITYGAVLEKGVLCCLCKQNISKKNILWSLMYPFLFIGIVTYVISIIFNNIPLLLLSICNISGAIGDLVMFFDFIKLKDFEYTEFDDPTSFALYSKNDLSNTKLFGIKYKDSSNEVNRTIGKKITITKLSLICFIIYEFLFIICLLLSF